MSSEVIDAPSRVVPNLIANVANYAARIGIAIWFVPFLVGHLGAAAYGLVPLAVTITSYLSIATTAISSAVSRDLILSLTRADDDGANRVFNSALFGLAGLAVLLVLPLAIVALKADTFFNVPAGLETSARHLFGWIGGSFLLMTAFSPFAASSMARHRLDLMNGIAILENLVRVGLVVLAFIWWKPDVGQVGMGTFFAAALAGVLNIFVWKKLTPQLAVRVRHFSADVTRRLTGTGSWVVVGHAGTLLLLSIDLVLVNRLFGAESGGRYALALQWAMLLRALAVAIAGTFTPTLTSLYAEGDHGRVRRMLRRSVKAVALFMALPIGLACGFSAPLLGTWLGPEFSDLAPLMVLLVAPLILNVPFTPVYAVVLAADRVREYGLVTLFVGIANPLLAWLLAIPCGWGMYGVAASSALLLAARSIFYDTRIASRILNRSCSVVLLDVSLAMLLTALIGLAGWAVSRWIEPHSWFHLALCALPLVFAFGALAWFFLLDATERYHLLPWKKG